MRRGVGQFFAQGSDNGWSIYRKGGTLQEREIKIHGAHVSFQFGIGLLCGWSWRGRLIYISEICNFIGTYICFRILCAFHASILVSQPPTIPQSHRGRKMRETRLRNIPRHCEDRNPMRKYEIFLCPHLDLGTFCRIFLRISCCRPPGV